MKQEPNSRDLGISRLQAGEQVKSKQYIKEAEQNVINQARFYTDLIGVLDSMQRGMLGRMDRYSPGRDEVSEGFLLIQKGVHKELSAALARCLLVIGVGGEEAEAYSREQARRVFGKGGTVMEWLDEWNRLPSCWSGDDEAGFREELQEALKD